MGPDIATALRSLLRAQQTAALATLHNGEPALSMVPYALLREGAGFVIHVSHLAVHTSDMLATPAQAAHPAEQRGLGAEKPYVASPAPRVAEGLEPDAGARTARAERTQAHRTERASKRTRGESKPAPAADAPALDPQTQPPSEDPQTTPDSVHRAGRVRRDQF